MGSTIYKSKFNTLSKTLILFYKQLGSALAIKVAYIFKVFGAQSCLMVA